MKNVVKNISYSLIANIVNVSISVLLITVLPKYIDVADYSVWQLYLFYVSYLGIFHFGWIDGIYLRYGGEYIENLDRRVFTSQIILLLIFEVILAVLGYGVISYFISDRMLKNVLSFSCFVLPAYILYWLLCYLLQITNNIKKYGSLVVFERFWLFLLIALYLIFGFKKIEGLILANSIAIYSATAYGLYLIRELLCLEMVSFQEMLSETNLNIKVGSKLLVANLSGMLMLGIVRFGISYGWDIVTFGKVSLTLSISNFFMVFINSLSVVFFPMLKRVDTMKQKYFYLRIRTILMIALFMGLLVYYPLKEVLIWWLPKYEDALSYMAVLFPICLFESRVALLTNNYLKSLRQEAMMMKINILMVIISCFFTYLFAVLIHNLNFMVISILLLYAVKSMLSEYYLIRFINVEISKFFLFETVLILLFVLLNCFENLHWTSLIIYCVGIGIYSYLNKNEVSNITIH